MPKHQKCSPGKTLFTWHQFLCILCALLTCSWRIIHMGELWSLLSRLLSFSREILRQTKDQLTLLWASSICSWAKGSQWICPVVAPGKQLVFCHHSACDTGTGAGVWFLKMTEVAWLYCGPTQLWIWEQMRLFSLYFSHDHSRVVFLQLKSLFCFNFFFFFSFWV